MQTGKNNFVLFGLFSIFYFLFSVSSLHAASTNFVTRTLVGDDTTPPSVPGSLTATPIATSQINLTWGTSTDDVLLSGYQVFRDDIQIATTTNTYYEDTGLVVSTTYTYFVTAFDSFNNFSASSSPVSTTTLASSTPSAATSTDNGPIQGSKRPRIEILSLEVIPGETGALIRYETSEYLRSVVRWGITSSYEMGSSIEQAFRSTHEVFIRDLRPDTRYRFSIGGEESRGREVLPYEGSFKTLPSLDVTPPGVVTGLTLTLRGSDVGITWENPGDADFDHVRVVRSSRFFPSTEIDGWVVYDGEGESTTDEGVAKPDTRLYYAVFAYDRAGNISAGAVASLLIGAGGTALPIPIATTSVSSSTLSIDFADLQFFQDEERVPTINHVVTLDGSRHMTIVLPYNIVPAYLKTILVRVVPTHDREKELSFILRANDDMSGYLARLAPFGTSGTFVVSVTIFDFETRAVASSSGELVVVLTSNSESQHEDESAQQGFETWHVVVFVLSLLLILLIVYRLLTRDVHARQLSNEYEKTKE